MKGSYQQSVFSFSYDGAGNRLKAIRNGIETRYIYDARKREKGTVLIK